MPKITNIIIFGVLAAALIVGLYYYLRSGSDNEGGDDNDT